MKLREGGVTWPHLESTAEKSPGNFFGSFMAQACMSMT